MKFGVNTFIWSGEFGRPQLGLLDRIKELLFDGVEAPLIHPEEIQRLDLRRELARRGLGCTFCSVLPSGLNAIDPHAAVRDQTRRHLGECIRVAGDAGARIIAGPLYAPVGYLPGRRRTSDEWLWAVECFQSLGDLLSECGVTLAIEPLNRFETYFLNTVADAVKLCDEVNHPNVGLLFDTFHANIEEKNVAAACLAAGPRLKHFHASENDRGTPGTGHVPWPGVFQSLRALHYDGWITIESFGFSLGELSTAASIWRDLAPTPESIAREGLEFLRNNMIAAGAGVPI